MLTTIKILCVIAAAILLGRQFRRQAQRTAADGQPVYRAYFSGTGLLVLLVLLLPVIVWALRKFN